MLCCETRCPKASNRRRMVIVGKANSIVHAKQYVRVTKNSSGSSLIALECLPRLREACERDVRRATLFAASSSSKAPWKAPETHCVLELTNWRSRGLKGPGAGAPTNQTSVPEAGWNTSPASCGSLPQLRNQSAPDARITVYPLLLIGGCPR